MRPTTWLLLFTIFALVGCTPIQPESAAASNAAASTSSAGQTPASQSAAPAPATDASLTPQAALERLFTQAQPAQEWFDAAFLDAVPMTQISEIIAQLSGQLGAFQGVEGETNPYTVRFELGTIPATINLNNEGQIIGLFFGTPTMFVASVDEAVAMAGELPGEVSLLVTKNGEEMAALNADTALGVGSAYKLAVLLTLRRQIEAGMHSWDEVVPLAPEWKAPPASLLREWPDDSPLTLHTLAALMISISDNTAADALLHIVGREEVEAITPNSRPLLTTQELFKLKSEQNAALLERYRSGDEAAKCEVLAELAAAPPVALEDLSQTPILDVEWFFTARELCDLMAQVEDLPLMSISPGAVTPDPQRWSHIAFKGGSELGVLNLTTWLETPADDTYCVAMTQNNPDAAIDETQFTAIYNSLVAALE